ncbi:MAG: threonine--tRNA ligase [Candidatus Aenigmatarchaeota archaeon]|nr:MAG: threonine--tRNA ligase [Candidatus Aenigmarchaeota archaeon]
MKILFIHADWIEWELKQKAISQAEESEKKQEKVKNCLVAFSAVEEADEREPKQVIARAVKEILDVMKQVKAKTLVLYPYAHLSSKLASPQNAFEILKQIEEELVKRKIKVKRAPFGWYKAFCLKCKGHPLSELSREFGPGEVEELVSESLKKEEKIKSEWFILEPNGKLHRIGLKRDKLTGFDFSRHPNLEKFARYEIAKSRIVTQEPPHVRLMRKLEIADYEPGSDPGNLRYYPKGRLIKQLLEEWVGEKVRKFGAMEIESPVMYDFEHPALKDYLNRFPARQYIVESAKKKFFLRFSACFGQFLIAAGMNLSYRFLPFRLYELTRYSFRLEKAGELTGLRRLRAFTMPDMHTFCQDLEQAKEEYKKQFKLCMECMQDLGFRPEDYETAIRFTEEFWKKNKSFILELVKLVKKPVLIERWKYRYAYFDPKFEFNFIDALDKASALSTVQIDHENAKRYGVKYTDSKGKERYPIVLHCSPSGGIERCMYAMLEKAWMKNPERALLPFWLSPIQIRLCPVNDSFIPWAEELAEELENNGLRVDIDDRTETVQKKIRDAELEWIPLIVVLGEREKKSGKLAVRFRESGEVKQLKLEEILKWAKPRIEGKPFKPLPLPRLLSKRPTFLG